MTNLQNEIRKTQLQIESLKKQLAMTKNLKKQRELAQRITTMKIYKADCERKEREGK